jgi:hypothetical protein
MEWIFLGVTLFGASTFLVCLLCLRVPQIEECDSVPEEINRLLGYAAWLRDQQEATAMQFVELHEPETDYEIDELTDLVFNQPTNSEYAACMLRIMNHKYPRVG